MDQLTQLRLHQELWTVRRAVCELNLELLRRDLVHLEAVAPPPEPAPNPAPAEA